MSVDDKSSSSLSPVNQEKVLRVEIAISTLLRVGVRTSLSIVVLGAMVTFIHHPRYFSSPGELTRLTALDSPFPVNFTQVIRGLAHFRGEAIVVLGLALLVLTPVARVAISILAFVHQRDWTFVAITAFVLAMLLLSFVLGRVE
jgi:uncharacterized membrane protein